MAENLEARFWALARTEASRLAFEGGCEHHLRGFIRKGVERMKRDGVADRPEKIAEAEEQLSRFVATMVEEARRLGFSELHEPTFFAAVTKLCPIWPFC